MYILTVTILNILLNRLLCFSSHLASDLRKCIPKKCDDLSWIENALGKSTFNSQRKVKTQIN